MTDTGVDEHHWLFEEGALGAAEVDVDGFGAVRGAAAPVAAEPAEARPVRLHARAVPVLVANGSRRLLRPHTPLPFLGEGWR